LRRETPNLEALFREKNNQQELAINLGPETLIIRDTAMYFEDDAADPGAPIEDEVERAILLCPGCPTV
jgi:hypothetical protein